MQPTDHDTNHPLTTDTVDSDAPQAEDPIDWQDLEELYQTVAESIGGIAFSINQILQIPNIKEQVEYPAELAITVNGLNKDLSHFTDRLVTLHGQHQNQSGAITDQDEYIQYLSIGDQYRIISEEFIAVTEPVMTVIGTQVFPLFQKAPTDSEKTTPDAVPDHTSTETLDV